MKRLLSIVMIVALFLFVACDSIIQDGRITSGGGNTPQGTPPSEGTAPQETVPEQTPSVRRNGVTFDFSGAKAVAQLEKRNSTSRAAINVDSLGDFVKILADGTMENAITIEEGTTLSDIIGVYKSPLESSQDVFIAFSNTSTIGYDESTHEYNYLGRLVCVHSDDSIADILKTSNSDYYWDNYMGFEQSSISFDANGNLYFIASKNGVQVICQFDPTDDSLTEMVAAVEGTVYEKMQISGAGQWIFASGRRSSTYFLRAIPVNNPNHFVNVYYSSNRGIDTNKWIYDDNSKTIYFIVQDGKSTGLFIATEAGGFRDKSFIRRATLTGKEDYEPVKLFESFGSNYSEFSWKYDLTNSDESFSANKVLQKIILNLRNWYYLEYYDYIKGEDVYLTIDDFDIRFDAFADKEGALRLIYLLTEGKKNEEALNALDCFAGKAALWCCFNYGYYETYDYNKDGYENNFISDILYVKDTDTLIKDYNNVILSYVDIQNQQKDILGIEFIDRMKKENGYYRLSGRELEFVSCDNSSNSCQICYEFTKTPAEILQYFFSFCNVDDEKEFRLTSFKDDENYSALYTTLTDEEALEWIYSDIERLTLFNKAMGDNVSTAENYRYYLDNYCDVFGIDWVRSNYLNWTSFVLFIAKTCFIKGTDKKAVTWNREENFSIEYSYSDGNSLFATENGVYYEYSNLNDWWSNDTSPFYYIVQVADASGNLNLIEEITKIDMPSGKVVSSQKANGRMFLQYSLMDENGGELGYHRIYSVNLDDGAIMNHFDNVANRNALEVVSFSVGGSNLYFSAVRGTSVENQVVDINTNESNPLGTNRKMVAVYSF